MNITYRIRNDEICDQNGNKYTVFGVDVFDDEEKIIKSVKDIFFDYAQAQDFVRRCNTEKLELIHLDDVVYNEIVKQLS